ncbi:MAG: SRPBCC family protein [Planctomycetota bacterium]|jgi:uncharacterized membrane protein
MRIEHSIEIHAPVSRVWELTLDVEAWPTFTPTITSIELLGDAPVRVGATARIKQPGQRARIWTVTELEPQRQFTWATRALGCTMAGSHELAAEGSGTRQTLAVELDGPLAPILGVLLRRPLKKALAAENEGFKAAAEES